MREILPMSTERINYSQCWEDPRILIEALGINSEDSVLSLTDSPETIRKKIMKYAFSGGKESIAAHRKHGGDPDVDVSYQYLTFFEDDDKKLEKIYNDYKSGKLLTGELKQLLVDKLNSLLREHQKRRAKAASQIDKFMLRV